MIIGLGNDLCDIRRIEKSLERFGERFIQRVFTELDANQDGQINKSEADIVVRRMHFNLWDLDGDNVATAAEVRQTAERIFSK